MKRLSMKHVLMSLTLLGSVAMPAFAADWELERPPLGGKGIYSYGSEMFREPELFRESRETEMRSKSDSHGPSLAPSVGIPSSVDGDTGGLDRLFSVGRGPEGGDPSVQGLSRMDGGGFSSNGGGSVPGYHGR